MSIFITLIVSVVTILFSWKFFWKLFNHLSIYTFSWMLFIVLYQLKLMDFIDISVFTWEVIISTFLAYLFGIITIFLARDVFSKNNIPFSDSLIADNIFSDDGRTIRLYLIIFSLLGLLSAILHWMVLIHKFGSITAVLIRANIIYRLRVQGEIKETVPYLLVFSYAGIFLAGIYTAYKNKLTFVATLPLIAVILKDMASVGRGGIFVGFLEFVISFFLFRHYIIARSKSIKQKLNKRNLVIAMIILLTLFVASSTMIKIVRGNTESFKASTKTLNKLKGGEVITPSIYLYFSSNIGVLSKYFFSGGENPYFGENTFLPVYDFLSKFHVIEHPNTYPKGYFIPMWTNSATYLRDLHADFGFWGLILVPYLLGILTTFYWFRFYEKHKFIDFVILVYLYLIISFSVFYMVTRSAIWFLSLIILVFITPILERKKNPVTL